MVHGGPGRRRRTLPAGERLVAQVRALDAPFDVLVGGPSADLVDSKEGLFGQMPLAAALIGITTFVLLFLMFGGILVPIKAIVLNLLSLTATFGALVWIFQDGHLSRDPRLHRHGHDRCRRHRS